VLCTVLYVQLLLVVSLLLLLLLPPLLLQTLPPRAEDYESLRKETERCMAELREKEEALVRPAADAKDGTLHCSA
jgi:hypothetical protein